MVKTTETKEQIPPQTVQKGDIKGKKESTLYNPNIFIVVGTTFRV